MENTVTQLNDPGRGDVAHTLLTCLHALVQRGRLDALTELGFTATDLQLVQRSVEVGVSPLHCREVLFGSRGLDQCALSRAIERAERERETQSVIDALLCAGAQAPLIQALFGWHRSDIARRRRWLDLPTPRGGRPSEATGHLTNRSVYAALRCCSVSDGSTGADRARAILGAAEVLSISVNALWRRIATDELAGRFAWSQCAPSSKCPAVAERPGTTLTETAVFSARDNQ